jgi:carbonic anhydrase
VTATEELVANNRDYVANFAKGDLPMPPGKKVAVLACMDARLDPARALGLEEGDAHVIRNAGGVASEDAIRSLLISQRLLGTDEIIIVHHTDCGMLTFTDGAVKDAIQQDTGIRPSFALEAFPDLEADVVQTIARIKASPFIPFKDNISGFVYEVETGRLRPVAEWAGQRGLAASASPSRRSPSRGWRPLSSRPARPVPRREGNG